MTHRQSFESISVSREGHVATVELRRTADYREGVKAMAERRVPNFTGA